MSSTPKTKADGPSKDVTVAVKPSAETLGINRPTPIPELLKIVERGIAKDRSFQYWMNRATKWREELRRAIPAGNKEWRFVCSARSALILSKKLLKHPDLPTELSSKQITVLHESAGIVLADAKVLKKELVEAYAAWEALEQAQAAQIAALPSYDDDIQDLMAYGSISQNPGPNDADDEDAEFSDLENALDLVCRALSDLTEDGSKVPDNIKEKIDELKLLSMGA